MNRDYGTQFALLGFINPTVLLRLTHCLPGVSPRRWARLLGVLAAGTGMLPLAGMQRLRFGRQVAAASIDKPPIFIIGHWRSGTTHLHNVLSADPQFGTVRMFQCVAPSCSLVARDRLPRVLDSVMPAKRPMDNMEWPMTSPQEDEIALAKLTPYSWYLQFLFPQQALAMFERYVLLAGAPASARTEVQMQLRKILQVATLNEGGKRLLLKNPVHTARIPLLLDLFPDAQFIYIHRSPLDVYPSTKNLHRKILELTALQSWSEEMIDKNVLDVYPRLLERYQRDRVALRANQLVEVAYEDLEQEPESVVKDIYRQLGIPGLSNAMPHIERYIAGQAGYRKNRFARLSQAEEAGLRERWKLGFLSEASSG